MKILIVIQIVLCVVYVSFVNAITSEEEQEVTDQCCSQGETFAVTATTCAGGPPSSDVEPKATCFAAFMSCCERQMKEKEDCTAGTKLASTKQCSIAGSDIGQSCCDDCSFGQWSGESQGKQACQPPGEEYSPSATLRKIAAYKCCLEAAEKPETTTEKKVKTTTEKKIPSTTEKKIETTTEKKITSTTEKKTESTTEKKMELKKKCEKNSCEHICNDKDGLIECACNKGYRLQDDKRSCKDINECLESLDDLCLEEDTVCHNTDGAYRCVPLKKRDVGLSCPPGFKRNVQNQVCDDINECQLPRPPCPKYTCENTIGGYKCGGKAGKPFEEAVPGAVTEATATTVAAPKNDICPPGFRAGPDDECMDIDECEERLDDCQRLSQHCINTHGNFFCQDHVSKRCSPGFMVNVATGICEDIDECEESSEVCRRSEICVNLPGAYNCKSKISTLPKLATKKCQEGTRLRVGGSICEDIDECREGTHLCDQFQNCINTFGAHECRCKNGFELDSSSGSCVDIDECALKLDNCAPGLHCLNVLGSFTCTRRVVTTSTTTSTTAAPPIYEYEYYDSEEESTTPDNDKRRPEPVPTTSTSTTTRRPTPPTTSTTTPRPRPRYPYPDRPRYSTTSTTTIAPRRPEYTPRRPDNYPRRPEGNSTRPEEYPRRPEESPREPGTADVEDNPRRPEEYPRRPEDYPRRPEVPRRPEELPTEPTPPIPTRPEYTPRRPGYNPRPPTTSPRPETTPRPVVVTTPTPKDPNTDNDIDRGSPYDDNNLHCLNGFVKNEFGQCVDVDECQTGNHICSSMEVCSNRNGGYSCECITGFQRDPSGWCAVATTSSTTSSTTSTSTTTSTTTEKPHAVSTPEWPYTPSRPRGNRPVYPPIICDIGYTFDQDLGKCVDIDECTINTATCSPLEDCVNVAGGFRCVCGRACRAAAAAAARDKPAAVTPSPTQPTRPSTPNTGTSVGTNTGGGGNVITVGAQYGQRGPWSPRPTYTRLPDTGAVVTSCPWGYKLTPDKRCYDIDECERNVSECGPQQKCENFFGGYSCQCPAGHKLVGQNGCEDIDECMHGSPCSYNAECVNTVGSYSCVCGEGFRNAATNDKVCADVDECAETPHVCHQGCANVWGGYRCYCKRGYRLDNDNRTCIDVNECEEYSAVRLRGKICGGTCLNEPGSYRCTCPSGYKLSEDTRSCIDIDECETGVATCARAADPGAVCQNTRGSYHCHQIQCPPGYQLEAKHRCSRIRRSCPVADWSCLQQPSTYSYNFITFVANIYLPAGSVDLFTMHGPSWRESIVSFEMRMINVQASFGVRPADFRCFDMRPSGNICVISLTCSLSGPQVAELELTMSLYQRGQFAGSAVARLIVIVSEYDF